jgi:hypothetical protein
MMFFYSYRPCDWPKLAQGLKPNNQNIIVSEVNSELDLIKLFIFILPYFSQIEDVFFRSLFTKSKVVVHRKLQDICKFCN